MSRFTIGVAIASLLVFLSVLIVKAPASILSRVAEKNIPGLSYSQAKGSVWEGHFEGVSINAVDLGRASYRIAPLSILTGRPHIKLSLSGGDLVGDVDIKIAHNRLDMGPSALTVRLAGVSTIKPFGQPVSGRAVIHVDQLIVSKTGCDAAQLTIVTDFLDQPARQWGSQGFELSGPGRCDNEDLVVDLAGAGAEGNANLALRLRPDLSFSVAASAKPEKESVAEALAFLGFEENGNSLVYRATGNLGVLDL